MGAARTDTALNTADIALLSDDLSNLPYLSDLSQTANSVIRQNIWASLGAKAASRCSFRSATSRYGSQCWRAMRA